MVGASVSDSDAGDFNVHPVLEVLTGSWDHGSMHDPLWNPSHTIQENQTHACPVPVHPVHSSVGILEEA